MNIIFLDIDGVLNSLTSHYFNYSYPNEKIPEYLEHQSKVTSKIDLHDLKHLCLYSATNLAHILLNTENTKIVVSSTWRKRLSVEYFNDLLNTIGVTKKHKCIFCNGVGHLFNSGSNGEFVKGSDCSHCNATGYHLNNPVKDIVIDKTPVLRGQERGEEIKLWLKENKEKYNVQNFVILDDDGDMADYKNTANFIQTNADNGLTMTDAQKAIKVLKEEL